jgi:hypothetical protein
MLQSGIITPRLHVSIIYLSPRIVINVLSGMVLCDHTVIPSLQRTWDLLYTIVGIHITNMGAFYG